MKLMMGGALKLNQLRAYFARHEKEIDSAYAVDRYQYLQRGSSADLLVF